MSESLSNKTVEFASGVTGALPFHTDSTTGYLYPIVHIAPTELGGLSSYRHLSVGVVIANDQVSVKNAAGQLYGYSFTNINGAARYLKIYDKATAPTSTDTPKFTIPVPAGSGTAITRVQEFWDKGVAFASGIGFRLTTALADSDVGVVTANEHVVTLLYK